MIFYLNPETITLKNGLAERISSYGKITLKQLKNGPVLPPDYEDIAFRDFKFNTPSGKIELLSEKAEEEWGVSSLPSYEPLDSGDKDERTLHLITPNIASRIHSQFGNLSSVMSVSEEPAWEISYYDAKRLKLCNGDKVQISNHFGTVTGKVRITNRVKRGCIVFPNGIWHKEGGNVNVLIRGKETDMGYGAAFHDNLVKVERIES